jgi:hypothetical protein
MIQLAYQERDGRINSTLDRLERHGDEAAGLIRELLEEINILRNGAPFLNEDVVGMLSKAGTDLRHLEDSAGLAMSAADKLAGLEELVGMLNQAADRIRGSSGMY